VSKRRKLLAKRTHYDAEVSKLSQQQRYNCADLVTLYGDMMGGMGANKT
jgi:hypothetical protein